MWNRFINSLVHGIVGRFVSSVVVFCIIPALISSYIILVQTIPSWAIKKENESLTFWIIFSLLAIEVLIRVLVVLREKTKERLHRSSSNSLQRLLFSVSSIIQLKNHRFRECLREIRVKPFEQITQPLTQIAVIMNEALSFLLLSGFKEHQIAITVLKADHLGKTWDYFLHRPINYTPVDASTIMSNTQAAANQAIAQGVVFYPSKKKAASEAKYYYSPRDQSFGNEGSIYCKVVTIDTPDSTERSVITFSSYGVKFCDESDEESIASFQLIFDEFCRRIELELILLAMKEHLERRKRAA